MERGFASLAILNECSDICAVPCCSRMLAASQSFDAMSGSGLEAALDGETRIKTRKKTRMREGAGRMKTRIETRVRGKEGCYQARLKAGLEEPSESDSDKDAGRGTWRAWRWASMARLG